MNPETAVAALPPVNWTLEILKLIVPPLLTALAVLVGAWVAYRFANKARKEDILYKERYASFTELSGYLYEIARTFQGIVETKADTLTHGIPTDDFTLIFKLSTELGELIEKEPNKKYTAILKPETRAKYLGISELVRDYRNHLTAQVNTPTIIDARNTELKQEIIYMPETLKQYLIIAEESEILAGQIYADLGLPVR